MENVGEKRASASESDDPFRNTGCYEFPFQKHLQKGEKGKYGQEYIGKEEKLCYEKEERGELYDGQL